MRIIKKTSDGGGRGSGRTVVGGENEYGKSILNEY